MPAQKRVSRLLRVSVVRIHALSAWLVKTKMSGPRPDGPAARGSRTIDFAGGLTVLRKLFAANSTLDCGRVDGRLEGRPREIVQARSRPHATAAAYCVARCSLSASLSRAGDPHRALGVDRDNVHNDSRGDDDIGAGGSVFHRHGLMASPAAAHRRVKPPWTALELAFLPPRPRCAPRGNRAASTRDTWHPGNSSRES